MFLDTGSEEKLTSNTPLEPGVYTMSVAKVDFKTPKSGQGQMISVEFDIEDSNRKFWDNFNIVHANEVAQKLGRAKFADLVYACTGTSPALKTEKEAERAVLYKTVKVQLVHRKNKMTGNMDAVALSYWTKNGENRSNLKLVG